MMPGGNPAMDEPVLTPTSPLTWVAPVLVTSEAPSTAKVSAAPSPTTGSAAWAGLEVPGAITNPTVSTTPWTARRRAVTCRRLRAMTSPGRDRLCLHPIWRWPVTLTATHTRLSLFTGHLENSWSSHHSGKYRDSSVDWFNRDLLRGSTRRCRDAKARCFAVFIFRGHHSGGRR
jgi:hypothetical protein